MADKKPRTRRTHLSLDSHTFKHNSRTGEMELRLMEYDYERGDREVVMKIDRWQLEHLHQIVVAAATTMRDEAIKAAQKCGVQS
jgi:hypothetical protein